MNRHSVNQLFKSHYLRATIVVMISLDLSSVLLGEKRRGRNAGKIVLPGGKHETGETGLQCAIREAREETGIILSSLDPCGRLIVHNKDPKNPSWEIEIFRTLVDPSLFVDEETEELRLSRYPVRKLPFENMFIGDDRWLPTILPPNNLKVNVDLYDRGDIGGDKIVLVNSIQT